MKAIKVEFSGYPDLESNCRDYIAKLSGDEFLDYMASYPDMKVDTLLNDLLLEKYPRIKCIEISKVVIVEEDE